MNRSVLSNNTKIKIAKELTVSIEKGKKGKNVEQVQCYLANSDIVKIPLHYAVNVLNHTNDDINYFRKDVTFSGELRSHQKELLDAGLERLAEQRAFSLIASPGAGKTVMGIWYAARLSCVTCILIDRQTLVDQWIGTITKFTKGSYWVVDDEPFKCSEGETEENIPNFIICMNLRTQKIPDYIRKEVALLIIDEAHKFCTKKNFTRIMEFSPIYLIAMTATPGRADNGYELMHKLSGNDYVRYSSNKPVEVVRVNTPFTWSREVNPSNGEIDWPLIETELHYSIERNNMLLDLIKKNSEKKIMIFSGRKDHVSMLYETLNYYDIKCDYMTGNKKSYIDSDVLVGTSSKIGTGFDEATFCPNFSGKHIDMIIIFNSYKSLIQLEQNIGRSRADFPVIYHFVDKDSIIYNHWLALRKFYLDESSAVKASLSTLQGEEGEWVWPYNVDGEWVEPTIQFKNVKAARKIKKDAKR